MKRDHPSPGQRLDIVEEIHSIENAIFPFSS